MAGTLHFSFTIVAWLTGAINLINLSLRSVKIARLSVKVAQATTALENPKISALDSHPITEHAFQNIYSY